MKDLIPTKDKPIIYDENCIFYTDKLIMDGETYVYDNIVFLFYEQAIDKINGYKLKDEVYIKWFDVNEKIEHIDINGDIPIDGQVNFEFKRGLLPSFKKNSKQLIALYNYIAKLTYQRRLELYLNTFIKYNKLNIFDIVIHNEGDLYDEGVFQGNIVEKYKKDELLWGDSYGSYQLNVNDPFHFGFQKGSKFFGLIKDNFQIRNICNKDVFDTIIAMLINKGRVI